MARAWVHEVEDHRTRDLPGWVMGVLTERARFYSLTPREKLVVSFVLRGYANKEIAERCHISEQTVKDHLKHVYEKVGIHQRTALLARLLGTTRP
jgi:DNA-binding NarL/FixJ family response regulator